MVIFYTGRLCAEEFLEVFLLCANGHGVAALILLRGMYERAVTIGYLRDHPEEVEAYIAWEAVQRDKVAAAIKAHFADILKPEQIDRLSEAEAAGRAERPRFEVADCRKCGTTRLNHTWSKLDFVAMARAAPGIIGQHIVPCYSEPLAHAHARPHAITSRLAQSEEGVWRFTAGPQPVESAKALILAHLVLLYVLKIQYTYFKVPGLEDAVSGACSAYEKIWDNAET